MAIELLRAQVVQAYPHDPGAFTQGLVLSGNRLFESTGLEGRSSLREVDLATGRVLRRLDIPAPVFAEGLALVGSRLFQITWKHETVYTYDRDTFKKGPSFPYTGEGWGLCHNGTELVMSDGSATLRFRGPETFRTQREVVVREAGQPVDHLNELECVGPHVYANVWMTDRIVRIDPKTGAVTASIDASGLLRDAERFGTDVLNGIAHDPATDTFLITGKLWPKLFRVRFVR
jgi:glutaminyl-peptide cyclotransferase